MKAFRHGVAVLALIGAAFLMSPVSKAGQTSPSPTTTVDQRVSICTRIYSECVRACYLGRSARQTACTTRCSTNYEACKAAANRPQI